MGRVRHTATAWSLCPVCTKGIVEDVDIVKRSTRYGGALVHEACAYVPRDRWRKQQTAARRGRP